MQNLQTPSADKALHPPKVRRPPMLQGIKIKHRVSLHHLPLPQTQISFVSLSTQDVDPSSLHHLDSSLPPPLSWAWLMGGTNRRSEGGKTEVWVCLIELPPYLLRYPSSGAAVFSSAAGPFRQPFSFSCCSMNHGPSSCCSDLGAVRASHWREPLGAPPSHVSFLNLLTHW